MTDTVMKILEESWHVLQNSSVYMLFGFCMAGVIKAFFSDDFVNRHLGKGRFGNVFKAAVLGIPIPL